MTIEKRLQMVFTIFCIGRKGNIDTPRNTRKKVQ